MTLRCLWVASNENAERVLGGLENNTKSAQPSNCSLLQAAKLPFCCRILYSLEMYRRLSSLRDLIPDRVE
jgi:hypothetical protein